jgi:hypothetical protein
MKKRDRTAVDASRACIDQTLSSVRVNLGLVEITPATFAEHIKKEIVTRDGPFTAKDVETVESGL